MPNFAVKLDDGRTFNVDADRQPTQDEVLEYLKQQQGAQAPKEEPGKTSALGAFTRAAGAEVGPTAAAMAAFPAGFEAGAGLGTLTGPAAPIVSPILGFVGGAATSTIAALGAKKAQHGIAHALAPQTVDALDKLRDSDVVEHPVASAVGDVAAMVPSFEVHPFRTAYGLAKLPKLLAGTADALESTAAKAALSQVGTQAALTVGQTAVEEHRLPTAGEIAEGTVAAMLFHEPRFKRLPRAVGAAAASLVEKGKGLYASKDEEAAAVHGDVRPQPEQGQGQVSPEGGGQGVQPPAQEVAQGAQVSLEKPTVTGKSGDWTVTYKGQTEHYTTLHHAKAAADELETGKRGPIDKPPPGVREDEHNAPLSEEEQIEREKQVEDALEHGRKIDEHLLDTAKRMGVDVQQHEEPLQSSKDDPFADRMAYMDKETGTMHVNRQALHNWLSNIPEAEHGRAIETLVNHEKIHSVVGDKDAMDYWNNLTWLEKQLVKKRYTGKWGGLEGRFTEQQFAHEAIRGRIEQLSHMTPTEVVDAVAEEHWTNRMVYWMEDMIARLRKQFSTTASRAQHDILDRMMRNLEVAKKATEPLVHRGEGAPPEAFARHAEDPEDIAKEIGYDFKRNEFPGVSAEGMSEEDKAKFREGGLKPVWEFTNRSASADDPMGGHTFYVPEGSSRTDIMRRYNQARKEFGQPPEAFRRKKETPEERVVRELHEAQAAVGAIERRHKEGMAVHPDEMAQAREKLVQAWKNALAQRDFPEAFNRQEDEAPFEPSRAKGGGSKQFPATQEDWDEWVRLRQMPLKKPDGTYDMDLMQKRENMKNRYNGMPPLPPGSRPIEAFDRRAAEREQARREAERLARIKRKAKKGTSETTEGLFGEETTTTPTPKQAAPSSSVEEELRRREAASQRKIHREALEGTDVPPGALGQQTLFMPPSAERVVVPSSAVEAGAHPGITAAEVTGIHGAVDEKGNPVPDKPGFADEYLKGDIKFSAAPRTRETKVQGETEEYTEYRRRSERPNYEDFKAMLQERLGARWPEDRIREVWNDAVSRQLQEADDERLIQWAKSSRSKILRSWQNATEEEALRRLEPGAPEINYQEEEAKAERLEGKGTTTLAKPGERPTKMEARPSTSTFALEGELIGKQHDIDVQKSLEFKRLRRERIQAAGEKARRANRNRQTIIGQLLTELMNETKPPEQSLDRSTIELDDIDYGNTATREGAVRDISEAEAKDPQLLATILGDKGGRSFPNASGSPVSHTKRVVALLDRRSNRVHLVSTYTQGGRGEVEVAKMAEGGKPKEGSSITKPGKAKVMVVDPGAAGVSARPNADINEVLKEKMGSVEGPQEVYRPIQTLLVRNPVKNFIQTFDSPEDYFNTIGREAAERQRAHNYQEFVGEAAEQGGSSEMLRPGYSAEVTGSSSEQPPERPGVPRGTEVTEGEGGMFQGPHADVVRSKGKSLIKRTARMPIQASEALALQNHVLEYSGGEVTPEKFTEAIAQAVKGGYAGKERKVVSAIVKATEKAWEDAREKYNRELREWRGLPREKRKEAPLPVEPSPHQVYEKTLKGFFEAITSTETAGDYVENIVRQFGRPATEELSPHGQPVTEPSARGESREVTIGRGRDVFGRPTAPRQGKAPGRFPLPRSEPGATGEANIPPEMLAARPAPSGEQGGGPTEEPPEALEPRNITLGPSDVGQRRPPGLNVARIPDPNRTTISRMVPSPGMDIVSAPGGHPLGGKDPWEGRFQAEAVRETSQREPNVLEAEATRLRGQSLRKEQLEKKGKYLPGMGPEAFNRNMKDLQTDWENLKANMIGKFTRRQSKENLYTQRDATENIGNIEAANRGNVTRDASLPALSKETQETGRFSPSRAFGKEVRGNRKKSEQVLRSAVAVISSGDIVSGGPMYTDKYGRQRQRSYWQSNKQKVTAPMAYLPSGVPDVKNSGLIALAQDAMRQAQFTMTKTDPWYQAMGRKWYAAAKELRDAAVWARDNWLDPELKRAVSTAREQLRDQWQKEAAAGMRMRRDWNYVPGRYDAELWNDDKVFFGAPRILGRNFRQPSTFDNYYDAIHAGPYIAKNLNIADLVEHRSRQGNAIIGKNNWYTYLMGAIDPRTQLPLATEMTHGEPQPIMEKGQLLRDTKGRYVKDPQGNFMREPDQPKRDDKGTILTTPGKSQLPQGYEPVVLDNGRKILGVLTAYKNAVLAAAGESPLRQYPITREALHLGQYLKHYGILIYDSFHPARLAQYATALGGHPLKFNRGYAALEYNPADLDRAVEVGSVLKSDADWARENIKIRIGGEDHEVTRHGILKMALEQGANLGRLQDALFSQTKHWLPGVDWMNRKVFREITRGMMSEALVRNFEQLNAKYPKMNAVELLRDVSKDMNFFFGSIGRQGLVKSPMARDFLQMIMLAPQWVEGLAQKEARFYSRLTGASTALGREGPYLGALGGAMAKGLAFWFVMTQAFNLMSRRQSTFQNEEEGHSLDAWVPAGHSGFWISPMGVFAELSHDVLRMFETKPTAWDALEQVGKNKLGPWGRMGVVLTSKQNDQGEFIPTTAGRLAAAGQTLLPVPITLSWGAHTLGSMAAGTPLRGMVPASLARPPQPGSFARQMFASGLGVKGQPADSPLQRMNRLASRFVQSNHLRPDTMEMTPTTEPSYSKLRSVIRAGDAAGAARMLDDLRKSHTDNQIYHAMATWARAPLTGSHNNERLFVSQLTPEQLSTYSLAMEERLNIFQSYLQVYQDSLRGR